MLTQSGGRDGADGTGGLPVVSGRCRIQPPAPSNERNGWSARAGGRKQILIIGDSRSLAIRPHLAEEWSTQFAFANAAVVTERSVPFFYFQF